MSETTIETVAVEFLSSFFGVVSNLISTFVWWWAVYVLVRYLLLNIVFKNDESGRKRFAGNIRLGFEELSGAFLDAMAGLASIAKQWAEERKEEQQFRKASMVKGSEEPYWLGKD